MKLLVILSILSFNIFAVDLIDCKGQNCEKRSLDQAPGSGLISFDDNASDKTKPMDLMDGDQLPNQKGAIKAMDLKWNQLRVGQCLVDTQNYRFYKILKKDEDRSNQMITVAIEEENHENSLTGKLIFFNSDESASFRKLRFYSCNQTPHLADSKYIKTCMDTRTQVGNFLCNPDRFNR